MYAHHVVIINKSGVVLNLDLSKALRAWSVDQVQNLADGETLELDADGYQPSAAREVQRVCMAAGGDPTKVRVEFEPYVPPEE